MAADSQGQYERILELALDLAPDDQASFVRKEAGEDSRLFADLMKAISLDKKSQAFFDSLSSGLHGDVDPHIQTQIGPYRILSEIGRGGMGVVYLAERSVSDEEAQFSQTVALKLVRRERLTDEGRRRFLAEREILASLNHPNIAHLLDGGVTESGEPYIVLEYVSGLPLLQYCDENRLSIDKRIDLFEQVVEAVSYAHASLIIHRDLKPSNILVTEDGTAKLLDFGIAKPISPAERVLTQTETANRMLTPAYASPEQVLGSPITTASDVYQLGLLLYELLSGHRAHRDVDSAAEVHKIICEEEPTALPAVILSSRTTTGRDGISVTTTSHSISQARGTTVDRLRRRLKDDVEEIVMKALRKEPEKRYRSASALLDDLERYRSKLPVTARKGSTGYRLGKFLRRNKIPVIASLLVAGAIVAGSGVALWQRSLAFEERGLAERQAQKAERVTEYLAGIFAMSDPANAQGDTLNVYDILALGSASLEEDLSEEPEAQGDLFEMLGNVYREMGDLMAADSMLRKAVNMRTMLYGQEHPDAVSSLNSLGQVLYQRGRFEEADSLYRLSLTLRRALFGEEHNDVAESINNIATVHFSKREYAVAESLWRNLLPMSERLLGRDDKRHLIRMSNLAVSLYQQDKMTESAEMHGRVLASRERTLGPKHPDVIVSRIEVANVYSKGDEFEKARTMAMETLDLARDVLGPNHPDFPLALLSLGDAYNGLGSLDSARVMFDQALEARLSIFGPDHRHVVHSYDKLVVLAEKMRNGEMALEYAVPQHEIAQRIFEPQSYRKGIVSLNLARALEKIGRPSEARPLYQECVDIFGETRPEGQSHRRAKQGLERTSG